MANMPNVTLAPKVFVLLHAQVFQECYSIELSGMVESSTKASSTSFMLHNFLGPQGEAMKIDRNDYLHKEFDVEKRVPHVTLLVSEEFEQKHVGEMMAEAEEAVFAPMKEDLAIWKREHHRFIKIMITAQGQGQPQTVRMTHESVCSTKMDSDSVRKEMLRQAPEYLLSQHSTDIGLVKSAQPVKAELRPGVINFLGRTCIH